MFFWLENYENREKGGAAKGDGGLELIQSSGVNPG